MLKAVLFDLDGVLVDSERYSAQSAQAVLKEVGIVQSPAEKRLVFGRRSVENFQAAIDARGLMLDASALVQKKDILFAKLIKGKLKPLPGVVSLIGALRDSRIKVAVVSSSPIGRVNVSLGEAGLSSEFDLVLSGDCCTKGKPDPEPYLSAARELKVKPKECVVIEDAEAGVISGKAAGMKVLAVKSPNTHGQDLSKADAIVESLTKVDVDFLRRM